MFRAILKADPAPIDTDSDLTDSEEEGSVVSVNLNAYGWSFLEKDRVIKDKLKVTL